MNRLERIARAEAEIARLTADLEKIEPEYWQAYDVWLARPEGKDTTERKAFDRISTKLHATNRSIDSYKAQIDRLNHPATVAREEQNKTRLESLMATKEKKRTAADRGVPAAYLAENGNFRPGLDARFKSDLIRTVLVHSELEKELNPTALSTFSVEEAHEFLQGFGWVSHLDKARAVRIAKAEAANNRAEKAKAQATAKRSNGKAAAKSTDEAYPDPKPEKAPRSNRGRRSAPKAA